jgi:hypothetical protein
MFRPLLLDLLFNDDRVYVLELERAIVSRPNKDGLIAVTTRGSGHSIPGKGERRVWSITTRRNVPDYPPRRVDQFESYAEAVAFYKRVIVTTPRASLGEKSPDPTPSLEEYVQWLKQENLFDPLLNPEGSRTSSQRTRARSNRG